MVFALLLHNMCHNLALEDEIHAHATCPLCNVFRGRFGFSPDQNELIDSLSDQSLTPAQATSIA